MEWRYGSIYSWVCHLVDVIGLLHALTTLIPNKVLGKDRVGGCVDPRAWAGTSDKSWMSQPCWDADHEFSIIQTLFYLLLIYRMNYPGCSNYPWNLMKLFRIFAFRWQYEKLNESRNPIPARRTQEQKRNLECQWHLCCAAHTRTWIYIYAARERETDRQTDNTTYIPNTFLR